MRLNSALQLIADSEIKAVFIGTGSEDPDYDGIIYKGRVNHDDIPLWLNAADVFVLPTENEGCCNAIIEAMACGLPIISTDASFNHDILNEGNSIVIDCHDVQSIASAIHILKNDEVLRQRLSEGSLKSAEGLSISHRAEMIISFMQSKIDNDKQQKDL
jgi:glycosyltransferase involved in cell wall biosynthesis